MVESVGHRFEALHFLMQARVYALFLFPFSPSWEEEVFDVGM